MPILDEKVESPIRERLDARVMLNLPIAEVARPAIGRKTPPLDPRLDRGVVEIVENIRRQFHVAVLAVEIEDTILRLSAGGHRQQAD